MDIIFLARDLWVYFGFGLGRPGAKVHALDTPMTGEARIRHIVRGENVSQLCNDTIDFMCKKVGLEHKLTTDQMISCLAAIEYMRDSLIDVLKFHGLDVLSIESIAKEFRKEKKIIKDHEC